MIDEPAIADDPDDARRLVLADDLQQRGEPQGELIAIQCELARLPHYASAQRLPLLRREEVLLRRHRARWLASFSLDPQETQLCQFRRGFPHALYLRVERFIERAARIAQSTIRELSLSEPSSFANVEPSSLRLIESLRLQAPVVLRPFDACERLRALDLSYGHMPSGTLGKLAQRPALRSVQKLGLPSVTNGDVRAFLATSLGFPALTSISLTSFDWTDGARLLAGARWALQSISAYGMATSPNGSHRRRSNAAEILAQAGWTATLEALSLTNAYAGVAAFSDVALPALRRVSLCRSLDEVAAERLAQAPWASQIVELDISENRLDDAGLGKLSRGHFDSLTALAFRQSDVGDDLRGANLFVDAAFPKIRCVDLRGSNLGDVDMARLAAAPWLAHVVELDLSRNHITAKGLARLGKAPFKALTDLALEKNYDLGPRELDAFRDATGLEHLRIHY